MLVYSGCPQNIITQETCNKMNNRQLLKLTNIKLYGYSCKRPLKFLVQFDTDIETRKRITAARVFVVSKEDSHRAGNLLCYRTAVELKLARLMKVYWNNTETFMQSLQITQLTHSSHTCQIG